MVTEGASLFSSARHLARNPLGIIALFIVLIYAFASLVVGFSNKLDAAERAPVIWFLVLFPGAVLFVFAWLVSCHHAKLYSPADYREDASFIEASVQQVEVAVALGAATARKFGDGPESENFASDTRVAASRVAKLITAETLSSVRTRKILWVDDQHCSNSYERDALKALGFEIALAGTTEEAIRRQEHEQFDVVISDMSRLHDPRAGFTLLGRMRNGGSKTPYIIYSIPGSPEYRAEAWKRGAIGITDRPHDLVALVLEAVAPKPTVKAA
jgi:CheY-like chemotaxis protein